MFKFNSEKSRTEKLERIYQKYSSNMFNEANYILQDKHLAEDALQQAFLKLMKCVDKIDEDQVTRTQTFLKIISRNSAIDIYNKRTYLNNNEDAAELLEELDESLISGPSEIYLDELSTNRVTEAIKALPEIYRDIIMLDKVYGYSKKDIMNLLNLSEETAKKRMTRAKAKLQELLDKEGLE